MRWAASRMSLGGWCAARVRRRCWGVALLVGLLALCWPVLVERGVMAQCDYPCWASIIKMFDQEVFPDCRWFWALPFSRIYAGHAFSESYSLAMIVPWLLSKAIPVEWALKVTVPLACLVLGFGFYGFAAPKSGRFAAALAAYVCVLENLWYINHGMWYSSLAVGLAFFFFVCLERLVARAAPGPWLAAVVLFALAILAHPIGSAMALCGWLGLVGHLLTVRPRPGTTVLVPVLLLPVLGGGLAFPQIMATLSSNLIYTKIDLVTRYNPFGMLGPGLDLLVLAGAVFGLHRAFVTQRKTLWLVLPVLLPAYAVYRNLPLMVPFDFPTKGGLIGAGERFALVASAMLLVLFSLGLAHLAAILRRPAGQHRLIRYAAGGFLGLALLGTVTFGLRRVLVHQPKTFISEQALEDREDFLALCAWVAGSIDHERERVYVEDTYGRRRDFPLYPANAVSRRLVHFLRREPTFHTHYMSLLSLHTPCQQINGFPVFENPFGYRHCSNGRRLFGTELEDLTPEIVRERMWMLNCRHIIAFSDSMREFLESLGFLRGSSVFGRFCVFTWPEMPPHYAWSDHPDRQVIPAEKVSNVLYQVDLIGSQTTTLYLSVQYYRSWKAYLDGRRVKIEPWNGLMRIELPPGSHEALLLRYELNRKLPLTVMFLSGLLVLACATRLNRVQSAYLAGPAPA